MRNPWLLLQAQDILRADGIGPPQRLIEIFPVAASELCSQMVDEIGSGTLNDVFDLAILSDIAPEVSSRRVVTEIANPDLVTVLLKRTHQRAANRPAAAGYQDSHGSDAWRTDL